MSACGTEEPPGINQTPDNQQNQNQTENDPQENDPQENDPQENDPQENDPSGDLCAGVTCQANATCRAQTGECVCDSGYGAVGEECLATQMVECADESPEYATADVEDVEVT